MERSRNMTRTSPAELLFNSYRRQVLALLLLRPDESYHVREIARLTGVPPGSLHRELKLLSEAGFLLRNTVGNQVHYRANREFLIFEELASIFRKTVGLADVLREALQPLANKIKIAFVFGSVAQGKAQPSSDVDVFVVGRVSFRKVVQALAPTQKRLGREVNPVAMTPGDFVSKRKAKDRFVDRIIKEAKIFLVGSESDISGEPT